MPKVRTLQQRFAKGHIRQGEPTHFVEKVLNSIKIDYTSEEYYVDLFYWNRENVKKYGWQFESKLIEFYASLEVLKDDPAKHHTIRANSKKGQKHFKKGDEVQLAVWSGTPYYSPQIRICPPLKVTCYDFVTSIDIEDCYLPEIGKKYRHIQGMDVNESILPTVAKNDGLSLQDFFSWFKYPKPFEGQIIAWNDPKY